VGRLGLDGGGQNGGVSGQDHSPRGEKIPPAPCPRRSRSALTSSTEKRPNPLSQRREGVWKGEHGQCGWGPLDAVRGGFGLHRVCEKKRKKLALQGVV